MRCSPLALQGTFKTLLGYWLNKAKKMPNDLPFKHGKGGVWGFRLRPFSKSFGGQANPQDGSILLRPADARLRRISLKKWLPQAIPVFEEV